MSTSSKRKGKSGSTSSKGSRRGSKRTSSAVVPLPPVLFAAWMTKKGHFFPTMHRRFFRVYEDGTMRYFKDDAPTTPPLGTLVLTNATMEPAQTKKWPFAIKLVVKDKKKPNWFFAAESEEARGAWFDTLGRFAGMVNGELTKQSKEEQDPLELALQDIDLGIKARPIDVERVGKGLAWILKGIRDLNAAEPFDMQDPFAMNPDAAALLDVASLVCGLSLEHLGRVGGVWARPIVARVGALLFFSSAFSLNQYPAIKESPVEDVRANAHEFLQTMWEDSTTALALVPAHEVNLRIHANICNLIVKEKPSKRLVSLAKMFGGEVDALSLWASGKQSDKEARVFGYLYVRSARWFGKSWKRRFFVLHQESLSWYDKPDGKASGTVALKDIVRLGDGKPSDDHPWTLDVELKNGDKVELDTALQVFHAYWSNNLMGYIANVQGNEDAIQVKDRGSSIAIGGSMKVNLDAMHSAGADTAAAALAQRGRRSV